MKKEIVSVIASLMLSACTAAPKNIPLTESFDDNAVAPFVKSGTATISGHATIMRGDREISCIKVFLLPATAYFDDVVDVWRKGGANEDWLDLKGPNFDKAKREADCDANHHGAFTFTNLPEGRWYALSWIFLSPLSSISSGHNDKDSWGGKPVKEVQTVAGKTVDIVLTEKDVLDRRFMW